MKVLTLLTTFITIPLLALPACAQVGTMKWHFKSRADVVPALQKTRGNLRGTYDVLICATRQGYNNTALGYYEDIVLGHEFSATVQDSAAFAFAHDLADGFRPWNWKKDLDYSDYKGSNEATAIFFRDRAYKKGAHSSEILVMRAYDARYLFKENRKRAFEWTSKAVKRSPDWADAHYWLAQAAEYYGLSLRDDKDPAQQAYAAHMGRLGMLSYDKAERLDPGIRPYTYIGRIGLSRLIADKEAAKMIPIYADAHWRAFPGYATWYKKNRGKTYQEYQEMYARIASQIAQKATS